MKRYLKNPKAALCAVVCLVCLVALGAAVEARADELHLKDGTVIKGLIVSFDATTLKVKTNYGYAVIRRDTVASIVMSGTNSAKPMPKGPDTPATPAGTDAKNSAAPSSTPAPGGTTPPPSSTSAASAPPASETVAKNEPAASTAAASNAEPVKTAENKSATTSPSKPATTAATKPAATPNAPAPAAPAPAMTATNKPVSMPATSNTPTVNAAPGANAPKPTPVLTPKAEVAENNSKPSIPSNSALPSSIGSTPNGAENPKPAAGAHAGNTPPPPLIGTQSATNSENTSSGVALTRRPSKPSSKINQNGFQVESGSSAGYTSTVSGNVDPANPNHENLTPETAPGTAERMPTADDDGQPVTPGLRAVEAQPIREYIVANTYINQTYNFKMYRPPEWGLVEAAHNVLPGSIAALGTDDEKTYLLVGAAQATGSLDLDLRSADMKLKEIMDHYRAVRDTTVSVSGFPALERHFRGAIDQKEWSGAVVVFERGQHLYIVLGMTQADTDLSLLKENILQRVITSIDFSK